jgi:ABC-2 type transport system ATP-binding protein
VVILDEPTVGLDPIQIREIRALIRELGENHGIILSTHILPEVQATCSRVQIIHRGQLVFSATLAELQEQMTTQSLVLDCQAPPDLQTLEAMPGVRARHAAGRGPLPPRLHGRQPRRGPGRAGRRRGLAAASSAPSGAAWNRSSWS